MHAFEEIMRRYNVVDVSDADVIVALGGDGFLLHVLHETMDDPRPVYGMNRGTIGFLLNDYRAEDLERHIAEANPVQIRPLIMTVVDTAGTQRSHRAINEVSVLRHSHQSANLEIAVDGNVVLDKLVCDGVLISTPAGSTAYNLSAGGPVVPLGSQVLALTPVSPFRPRRWRGALLPSSARLRITNLDPGKRPIGASGDSYEVNDVSHVDVFEDADTALTLLFDPDEGLHDRVLREQFAS
ncbi:MAG: NAD kinase [Acidimicrobiia bacterium]|nr:NAD kinase [Acidimicrobiia bacterium]